MFCSGFGHGTPSYPCNRWPRRGSWSPWQRLLQVRCCPATGAQKSGQNQWPTFVNQLSHLILSGNFTFIYLYAFLSTNKYFRNTLYCYVCTHSHASMFTIVRIQSKHFSSLKRSRRAISMVLLCKSFFINNILSKYRFHVNRFVFTNYP